MTRNFNCFANLSYALADPWLNNFRADDDILPHIWTQDNTIPQKCIDTKLLYRGRFSLRVSETMAMNNTEFAECQAEIKRGHYD